MQRSESLKDLISRVQQLENNLHKQPKTIIIDEQTRRARQAVESRKCYSARWKWVPTNYYDLDLSLRAQILGVPSSIHLCKAMLMENKAYESQYATEAGDMDSSYSQFYLVVVQYNAIISNAKLNTAIRKLRPPGKDRVPPNALSFSVAKEVCYFVSYSKPFTS